MHHSNTISDVQVEKTHITEFLSSIERAKMLEQEYETASKKEIAKQLPDGYFFKDNELWYQPEVQGENIPQAICISSKLIVSACTRDHANENHGRLLEFDDPDGFHHVYAMPMELLAGDGNQYRAELLNHGLRISPGSKARQLLTNYIQISNPQERARCVSQAGWHSNCFVFPDATIGSLISEKIILQTSLSAPEYSSSGLLSEWKEHVVKLCGNNSRLLFGLCVAFASPLVHLLDFESGGFHLRGESSTGKTTILNVAASVWSNPKDFIQRWRTTINGLEALATGYTDTLLCLDEIAQVDPEHAGEIAYMLANGTGKVRADQNGFSRKRTKWRLLFLSTGEISLSDHMMQAGKRSRAGQEVRIIDIPIDTGKYGAFDELCDAQNPSIYVEKIYSSCQQFYGVAGRAFISTLIRSKEATLSTLRALINEFCKKYAPNGANGQVLRVIKRFALVAAAGEIAASFSILPWQKGKAIHAVLNCAKSWLEARGGTQSHEEREALAQVRHFFERYAESRFALWNETVQETNFKIFDRAGFKKITDSGIEFYVFTKTFREEICKGLDPIFVAKICMKQGLLVPDSNGKPTRSERLPGLSKLEEKTNTGRCYRFTSAVLSCNDECFS
jgi:putative DNA primase/helicase